MYIVSKLNRAKSRAAAAVGKLSHVLRPDSVQPEAPKKYASIAFRFP